MDQDAFRRLMATNGFVEAGALQDVTGVLRFILHAPVQGNGFVYLWVERARDRHTIVYVGMAGRTLKARCNQHAGGFRTSPPGKAHATRIREGLARGREYLVFVRKGGTGVVLGEEDIPLTTVEELAFIRKFRPTWNTALGA